MTTSASPQDPHLPTAGLATMTVSALQESMTNGGQTSAEICAALLARIAAVDAPDSDVALRAVLAVSPRALDDAEASDRERSGGAVRGPLHGIPVLIKDNIEAEGLPGSAGSEALRGRPVAGDAPLVTRLRAAGAIVLGSTNMSEWANFRSRSSTSGWSAMGGLTGNPWALDRSAGGSSSGSGAAVAAGLAPVAVGTETNGSITCPASLNGVVGLKATVGTIPTRGVVPLSRSQDAPGALARSVVDAAALFEVLSGSHGLVDACRPGTSAAVRVGVANGWLTGDTATDDVFRAAVDRLAALVGATMQVETPDATLQVQDDQVSVLLAEFVDDLGEYLAARPGVGVRSLSDVVEFNQRHAASELAHFDQDLLAAARACGGRSGPEYRDARRRNVDWARDSCLEPALGDDVDVLVSPAYRPAWKSDLTHGDVLFGGGAVCTPAAILGWPILTVPIGLVDGLPVAMSVVGRPGAEPLLLSVGAAVEQALGGPFTSRHPTAWGRPRRG